MSGPALAAHRKMHALWRKAGISDRDARLALTSQAIGRQVTTSNQLTPSETDWLIAYMEQLADDGLLAARAAEWLARQGTAAVA